MLKLIFRCKHNLVWCVELCLAGGRTNVPTPGLAHLLLHLPRGQRECFLTTTTSTTQSINNNNLINTPTLINISSHKICSENTEFFLHLQMVYIFIFVIFLNLFWALFPKTVFDAVKQIFPTTLILCRFILRLDHIKESSTGIS